MLPSLKPSLKRHRSNGGASYTASPIMRQQDDHTATTSKRCHGRAIQNHAMSFRCILVTFAILFLSSGSIFRFVNGNLEHRKLYRDEHSHLQIRGDLNKIWEGEQEGTGMFLKHGRGMDISLVHGKQGSHVHGSNRELSGELGKYSQQQNATTNDEELSRKVRSDSMAPPPSTTRFEDSILNGNVLVLSTLPVSFNIELIVKNTVTYDLLTWLDAILENHMRTEYQDLLDRNRLGGKDNVEIKAVDLTVSLIQSRWFEERRMRRLNSPSNDFVGAPSQLRNRNLQGRREKMLAMSVVGSINYSIEVDGSPPTPDQIEQEWREAYAAITSPSQLERAIESANINVIVRLEQVTQIDPDEELVSLYENSNSTDTNNPPSNETSTGTPNQSNQPLENNFSFFASKKGGPLQRPSLLAIILGFTLTGFLVLGLFGYLYLYCRHRKKQAKKKKKMKESITFPSASAAAATAAAATATPSKKIQNSPYYSKSRPQPTPPIPNPSPAYLNSVMLSQTQSEETTYGGIDSTVGSESTSDPFANELKLAASLDQEAWDESQRRKEMIQKREAARKASNNPTLNVNRNPTPNSLVPSLLSKGGLSLDEADDVEGSAIQGGIESKFGQEPSYPYGDEKERLGSSYQSEAEVSSSSAQWEPYNSGLPPLAEEKKDEPYPSAFFGRHLASIQNSLTQPRGKSGVEPSISDDVSDILSEVSEISKYVRRYENRKDRKLKREENIQERLGAARKASPFPSATQSAPSESDGDERPAPPTRQALDPYPLSSYAGSFRSARSQEAINESLSVVSDEVDVEAESSLRSQRLGISPYQATNDEIYYENGKLRNQENSRSTRTGTTSSRSRSTRTEEDYRYTVGYTADRKTSSPHRLSSLRSNDAIIDSSNSDVNVTYGAQVPARINNRSTLGTVAENNQPVTPPRSQQRSNKISSPGAKKFSNIRGMFEQKTNNSPAPIYPPGANWQNGGSLGR